MNKVQIMPDELGNVVRQSKNNTDFGYVRLQQDKVSFGNNGWVKRSQVSTLLHGKIEDFDAIGIKDKTELSGKIIVREQTEAFSANDPDRDLKYAGDTGVICCAYGEPIYRKTFFVTDVNAEDILIAHTNGDAIREANGFTTPQAEVKETAEEVVTEDDNENEDLEEEMVEETVDELDDSFEL
tara:strand:+ start:747 stop:1295 length:549 start_codon:yes stop_codon:yes gene_type:complete